MQLAESKNSPTQQKQKGLFKMGENQKKKLAWKLKNTNVRLEKEERKMIVADL